MAMSEPRRRKLELLARSLAKGDLAMASELLGAPGGSGIHRARAGPELACPQPIPLEQACPGAAASATTPAGEVAYWRIRRTLAEAAPQSARIAREYSAVLRGARQRFDDDAALGASPALCHAADARPEELLFLDAETGGSRGTMIFLVGMMSYADGGLLFEQCLARDCSEEPGILQAFAERYAEARLLVTFRGKTFDMKMVRERSALHGIGLPRRPPAHLDLLRESRRRWRADVPNCRLQTLERALCGRQRVGDMPDRQIPGAYHRFVATGDARQMGDVLHHNLLDLLTMAQLVVAILTGCGPVIE